MNVSQIFTLLVALSLANSSLAAKYSTTLGSPANVKILIKAALSRYLAVLIKYAYDFNAVEMIRCTVFSRSISFMLSV